MRHRLLLPFVCIAMAVWALPTAGQQGRPRRAPEQCAHDIESAQARHRAEARRCARQKLRGECEEKNDRRLNADLTRISAVCGDYISTEGEPDRGRDRPSGGRQGTNEPADAGGGPPPVRPAPGPSERPHVPPSDRPGLLPPGFPFPPAEARPPRPTLTPRPSTDRRPVIVALGDSMTAGYKLKAEEAYPAVLQRRLDAEGYRFRVSNAGVTGDTSAAARRRLDQALVPNTRILIVALGLNDFNMNRPIAEIRSDIAAIVDEAKQRGITVLLCGFDAPPAFNPRYEDQFTAIYPAIVARSRVPLLPDLVARVWPFQNLVQRDFIHPTAAGARVMADDVFNALRPMLRSTVAPINRTHPTHGGCACAEPAHQVESRGARDRPLPLPRDRERRTSSAALD